MQRSLLKTFIYLTAATLLVATGDSVHAQVNNNSFVNNYILNRPTVSPYLNLLRRDGFGGVTNYQTLVRPQIEQREFAANQQAEITRVQQQLAVQQRSLESAQQLRAQRVFSTGHTTRFMNLQQYYPGFSQLRR